MKARDTYASVVVVLSIALRLIAAGVEKKQLAWKRTGRYRSGAGTGHKARRRRPA